mmetsp:Transcript_8154/g.26764  ORF Transcript_8154/g.26764 Transcript_8154/m.26764 type:complete len:253 (+) Transcript_8154:2493-3251(+)
MFTDDGPVGPHTRRLDRRHGAHAPGRTRRPRRSRTSCPRQGDRGDSAQERREDTFVRRRLFGDAGQAGVGPRLAAVETGIDRRCNPGAHLPARVWKRFPGPVPRRCDARAAFRRHGDAVRCKAGKGPRPGARVCGGRNFHGHRRHGPRARFRKRRGHQKGRRANSPARLGARRHEDPRHVRHVRHGHDPIAPLAAAARLRGSRLRRRRQWTVPAGGALGRRGLKSPRRDFAERLWCGAAGVQGRDGLWGLRL